MFLWSGRQAVYQQIRSEKASQAAPDNGDIGCYIALDLANAF
jgi:hypothetical protein